ncbi:hypothetical protein AB0G54_05075 [Streptomyces yokosukanensis]|uniref:hypothetical protein n=1 Tax=Streptomyces yokosukanensis TaxID=67386 RepID=UPI00343A4F34
MTDSSFSDDSKVRFPHAGSPSDTWYRSHRKRLIVVGVAVVAALLVGGGTWLATSSGHDGSAQKAPVLPSSFGAYTEAKRGDTEWTEIGSKSVNTDISRGRVNLTYRASGGRALMISVKTNPFRASGTGHSDDTFVSIFNSRVDQTRVKNYPAGAIGGKIRCADVTIGASRFTTCGWRNDTTDVNLAPVLNHDLVVSIDAPADLRTFIGTLGLKPE